ncbi:MAG: hypothetical protein KGZ83_00290 [Sulfuricella sp.]|nr:hypothetical protein [Sulfuricella sp.]
MADFNRRFAVAPRDGQDAHWAYRGTREDLVDILSVQVERTLSKNLSCQHEGKLMQVKTSGTGLGMRGAKVTLFERFDGTQELRWRKRKLAYTVLSKAQRQAQVADSKMVNARVDKALAKRGATSSKAHKPAPNHP